MNYLEIISLGIKNLRLKNNLTQEKFAELIGLSVQGYRLIEKGKSQPSINTLDTICSKFNISPLWLLLPQNETDLEKLLINKIKSLSKEQQEKLNNFLNANII